MIINSFVHLTFFRQASVEQQAVQIAFLILIVLIILQMKPLSKSSMHALLIIRSGASHYFTCRTNHSFQLGSAKVYRCIRLLLTWHG